MLEPGRVYLGDCLEVMGEIADGSVDMILCDLPYGAKTACAWDNRIPLEPLWAHYKRIIKPNGAIVLTASQPFTSVLVMSNLAWFKYEWVWDKVLHTEFHAAQYRPMNRHETILIFSNAGASFGSRNVMKYNPITTPRKKSRITSGGYIQNRKNPKSDGLNKMMPSAIHTERYPTTIISLSNADKTNVIHPTQKPVALFAYLIRTYTNPGELVLDNCIGSGTTAIAAIETGRRWIGIEKDAEYHRLATERIEQRLKQPFLPGLVEPVRVNGKQLAMEGV